MKRKLGRLLKLKEEKGFLREGNLLKNLTVIRILELEI